MSNSSCISVSVQNGSIHQKDAVNDDDFEPYLSSQTNQVSIVHIFLHSPVNSTINIKLHLMSNKCDVSGTIFIICFMYTFYKIDLTLHCLLCLNYQLLE